MNLAVIILMALGLIFFSGAAVGIIRFPDFYTRLHPAGKMDTLGCLCALTALALFNLHHLTWDNVLVSMKILLIMVFFFLAGPTATHAIVDAGMRAGHEPWVKPDSERES